VRAEEEECFASSTSLTLNQIPERKEIKMSIQNWQIINGVKVNNEIANVLSVCALNIEIDSETGYPWVMHPPSWCSGCASNSCTHSKPKKMLQPLHVFTWLHFRGPVAPGKVIHHRNHDKLDSRIKNLAVGTRSAHATSHNRKARKFSPRKRQNLDGFRFRPPQPGQVVSRPELVGTTVKVEKVQPKARTLGQQLFDLEEDLKALHPSVAKGMGHLADQGAPIPRAASVKEWRKPETRRLGLRMPRMACDEAEACFVLLYIAHGLDIDRVADDIDQPVALLKTLLKRVSVNEAINRWVKYRRIPTATLQRGFEEVPLQPRRRRGSVPLLPTGRSRG
jgi:hypothetical protein